MGKAFAIIGTLEEIHLPQNGIQQKGIAAFAEAVKANKNLRHLNLNDNTFTEKGALAMAEGIENINSLKIINFGDCLVRTGGAKAIAKALKNSNPNLEQLILSFGEIQLEGGLRICEALSGKQSLVKLDINGNQFGEDGVDEIKDLADENQWEDVLETLSDDEGCSSESEGESESSEEEESDDDVTKEPASNDTSSHLNGVPCEPELFAENFLTSVTPSTIVHMTDEHRAQLLEEVAELVTNADATAKALSKLAGKYKLCTSSVLSSSCLRC